MGRTGGSLLTGMRLRFVQAWKGNNREAAIAAGYSEKNADVAAAKLVRDPIVRRALEEKQEAILFCLGSHLAEQLAEFGATPSMLIQNLVEVVKAPPHEKRGYADRVEATKLLLQMYGLPRKGMLGAARGSGRVVIQHPDGTIEIDEGRPEVGIDGPPPYEAEWVRAASRGASGGHANCG